MRKTLVIAVSLIALLATSLAAQENTNARTAAGAVSNVRPTGMRLEWTHFIGGSREEQLWGGVAPYLDRDGMLYLLGTTLSPDFPTTPDALDPTYKGGSQQWGREDIFLLKLNTRQPGIVYSTLLGGAKGPEHPADVYVDHARNIYVVGNTGSSDFPTTGDALTKQFQGPDFRHADGFLTILGDDGRKLKYSTFIGGPKGDGVGRVFVEPSGEIILFGDAGSLDFLPAGVVRPREFKGASGPFVMKLDAKGQRILSARLLGDFGRMSIQRLDSGEFLIAGATTSPEISTTKDAFDRTHHGGSAGNDGDIFITRLSADLNEVRFATLFGGSGEDSWPKITAIAGGGFFVVGTTTSKNLPVTADAIEKTLENKKALFLARFSGDGSRLKYCTYLGGKGADATSVAVSLVYDGHSRIYLAGFTTSPSFRVTPNALQAELHGGQDIFLLAFNAADNSLAYGSYLGGSKDEWNPFLTHDENGAVYVIGATNSDDFPALDKTSAPRKGTDIFISKFAVGGRAPK